MARVGSEQGIVRLIQKSPTSEVPNHVGMGMLVDDRTVLTCAHVVNLCLGRDIYTIDRPHDGDEISLTFPIVDDDSVMQAQIVGWSPPAPNGLDCAILSLSVPAPEAVGRTILSVIDSEDITDDPLSVFGSLESGHPGAHVRARLSGIVGASWTQLEVAGSHGVEQGFSGGAVWDLSQRSTVGMLVARAVGRNGMTAYFLSSERIASAFGEMLPIEVRRIPLRRQRWFTGVAILLFFLMLVHFVANRSKEVLPLVPWAREDPHLAAFFGIHCFAVFLGPYVMWTALTQARSFALRPWWQRVPSAFGWRSADSLDNTRLGASAVILFLLLLPAYAQGFFLERVFWNQSGDASQVYVRKAAFVGLEGCEKVRKAGDFCTHPDAGIWSIVEWKPYFDYVYQISGTANCSDGRCMVAFYPILQPAVVWTASLLSLYWFLRFLSALIFPQPYPAQDLDGAVSEKSN